MTLTDARRAVTAMVARGVPLDQIESFIDTLPLEGEQGSALWLLAWTQTTNPAARTQVVQQSPVLADY
jgi:hypothetical protein